MKFQNVSDAFNHYRDASLEDIEKRAAEIKGTIDTDPEADVTSLNIEVQGLSEAKKNIQDKAAAAAADKGGNTEPDAMKRSLSFLTGAHFETRASKEATEGDVLASPEYRSAFFKMLMGKTLEAPEKAAYERAQAEQRADAYSSTTNTAAVIPTQTLDEVVSKARTMGGLLSVCRAFTVPAKISIPVGTPATAAVWNTEGTAVDADKPTVATVDFGAYEIIKVFSISASVRKMSVRAFESYLTDELASCVMACLADGIVNGTGTNQGTGVLSGVTWTSTNSFTFAKSASIGYGDVCKVVAALARGYANGASWGMSNATLYSQFYGMVDSNGRPVFIADPKQEGIGKILGFPVVVDDYLATDTVLFGNFDYMGYNLPEGIAVESSTESSFRSGKIDYRAMAIADCKPIVTEAFVKLSRATS